jgi:hypothetical protein
MTKLKPLIIYWSPSYLMQSDQSQDWNMLYQEPKNLFSELIKNKHVNAGPFQFFSCPAVSGRLKNTFIFYNMLDTFFEYVTNKTGETTITNTEPYGLSQTILRPSPLQNSASIRLGLAYTFFSEESVLGFVNAPILHKPNYTNYGTVISGGYDFSKWYRPVTVEILTWKDSGTFKLFKDEPLFYLEMITERPVILKRYVMSKKLQEYSDACVNAPNFHGLFKPLKERYKIFTSTRTNELVLKEIQKNLI